jgi:tetrapyrrole methylase family protein/MazG family protein
MEKTTNSFEHLFEIIMRLRNPGGCPWDIEQTPLSMRDSLVEEVFEAVEAISQEDAAHTKEELGDVLLNTLMIAYMHEQAGDFTLAQVFDDLSQKLVRRHPHVFSESEATAFLAKIAGAPAVGAKLSPDEVLSQWDVIKAGLEQRKTESILDEVAHGFPPLLKAYKLQKKAAKKGFDWASADEVYTKVTEELHEVLDAVSLRGKTDPGAPKPFTAEADAAQNSAQLKVEEEMGDLLFALVNWARHLGVDPVVALSRANEKFSRRFRAVEKAVEGGGKDMKSLSLEELDCFWEDIKKKEKEPQ